MRYYYLGTSEGTHSREYGAGGGGVSVLGGPMASCSVTKVLGAWFCYRSHGKVGRPHTCAHTPYLAPSISSIWLFLNCIMYNKLTLESEVPSWVLFGISSELSNLEKGLWEPLDFTAGQ